MALNIQAIRGMNDILPDETNLWQKVEKILRETLAQFSYSEIRMPIVEKTNLFSRAIGEVTDVVEKEMYTFEDRSGDSLSLRPEGTAGCVRACLEHNLTYNQEQRLWYMGPMFRHERPQKGRYRQFHQLGVECFGLQGPDIDAEIIILTATLWKKLGIDQHLQLQINTLGQANERAAYKESLVKFLEANFDKLDEDCKRRTHTNPLRVLDTKNEDIQKLLEQAPKLFDYLGEETKAHFNNVLSILDHMGIKYEINQKLVRGLDYYNLTVFEWVSDALGAQATVCGGGRYDGLLELLGGNQGYGLGFGLGLERLILLLTTLGKLEADNNVDVYVVSSGDNIEAYSAKIACQLRDLVPNLKVRNHCGGGNFKRQFKKADKLQARFAIILGEQELQEGLVGLKDLRDANSVQQSCSIQEAALTIKSLLSK